jgi:hypothetical protein
MDRRSQRKFLFLFSVSSKFGQQIYKLDLVEMILGYQAPHTKEKYLDICLNSL